MTPEEQLMVEAARRGLLPETGQRRGPPVDLTDFLVQGRTFGIGEEVGAAGAGTGAALKSAFRNIGEGELPSLRGMGEAFGQRYESRLGEQRAGMKEFREERPAAALGAEVLGGVTALPPIGGVLAKGLAALPAWMRAGAVGAGFGGLYGAGTAEGGPQERLEGGGIGAGLGAGTGVLAHGLIRGAQGAAGAIRRTVGERLAPETAATRALGGALRQDEMTPARMAARLRELGPQATLADAGGENVLGLARGAAGTPGPAKNRAAMVLNARAEAEADRIAKVATRGLKGGDYYVQEEAFLKGLRENAKPLYEEAYKTALDSKNLSSLLERPVAKKAMREAARLAAIEGRRVSPLAPELTAQAKQAGVAPKGGVGKGVMTEAVDDLKRGLDAMIEKNANEFTGRLNKEGFALTAFKNQLLREADRLNPAYAKARAQYAGDAEVLKALREGREFLKMDREIIAKKLGELSGSAKEAYRSGALRAIKDVVEKTPDQASAARRLFGNSMLRGKLRELFPDQKSFNEMARVLVAEAQFSKTRAAVLSGSRTTPMAEEVKNVQRSLGNIGAVLGSDLPMGGHALVRAGIGRKLAQSALGPVSPEYQKALSRMLLSRNQSANQGVIDQLQKSGAFRGLTDEQRNAIIRALVAGVSQQEGRLAAQNQLP
jgi:hypothetical protein